MENCLWCRRWTCTERKWHVGRLECSQFPRRFHAVTRLSRRQKVQIPNPNTHASPSPSPSWTLWVTALGWAQISTFRVIICGYTHVLCFHNPKREIEMWKVFVQSIVALSHLTTSCCKAVRLTSIQQYTHSHATAHSYLLYTLFPP